MVRKAIFWAHLACGVTAGLVILMMSSTGVLLTYERQMLDWADRRLVSEPANPRRLAVTELLEASRRQEPSFAPTSVTLSADPRAPVLLSAGRGDSRLLDPYTGEMLASGEGGLHAFFDKIRGWHRWFNVQGENRDAARAITGACNLAFLFLVLSGAFLWLPPVFNRVAFRTRVFFNPKAGGGKARDYNWHHVLGIWSAVPLAVIVASATVFYYGWANAAVYRVFGEEPPARVRDDPPPSQTGPAEAPLPAKAALSLDELTARAAGHVPGWRTLTLALPDTRAGTVRFTVDRSDGGQPQRRHEMTLDIASGAVVANERIAGTPGRRARMLLRFLHTGEALGLAGQTVAGLVSLASTIMVWTGLALAWRRLIRPLLAPRRAAEPAREL